MRVPRRPLREGRDGALGGRRCARPCSLHRQRGAPILGSSWSPDFSRAFWGTGGATENSARPWRMFARRADPCPCCARLQQLRAAQRSCAAGSTPQKSAGLRTTTLHSVAWAAGGARGLCTRACVQLTVSRSCVCSDQGGGARGDSPAAGGGPRAGSEVSLLAQSTATTAATPGDVPAQTPLEPGEQLDGVTALIHADGPVAGRTIQVSPAST